MLEDYKLEVLYAVQSLREKDFDALNIVINRLNSYKSYDNIAAVNYINAIIDLDIEKRKRLLANLHNAQHHKSTPVEPCDADSMGVEMKDGLLQSRYINVDNIVAEWVIVKELEDNLL